MQCCVTGLGPRLGGDLFSHSALPLVWRGLWVGRDAMSSLVRRALLTPFWLAQVLTQEKFFARNPVIGSRWLNEHGLHTARTTTAHRLAAQRRRRLARLISGEDRARLDRDGYIVKRDFLPAGLFAE